MQFKPNIPILAACSLRLTSDRSPSHSTASLPATHVFGPRLAPLPPAPNRKQRTTTASPPSKSKPALDRSVPHMMGGGVNEAQAVVVVSQESREDQEGEEDG